MATAAVTHQVAMHCHERGIVLAKIWNMQLGLLELEREQLRLGNESHINENRWLKVSTSSSLPGTVA